MSSLYQISTDILFCLGGLSDDGEISEHTSDMLDNLAIAMEAKLEGLCKVIRNLEADAESKRQEVRRLSESAQHDESRVRYLQRYIQDTLTRLGLSKHDAGLFKVRIQKNSQPSIQYDGEPRTLPEAFQKVTVELSRDAVKEAVKTGQALPEGVIVAMGSHLRIV